MDTSLLFQNDFCTIYRNDTVQRVAEKKDGFYMTGMDDDANSFLANPNYVSLDYGMRGSLMSENSAFMT